MQTTAPTSFSVLLSSERVGGCVRVWANADFYVTVPNPSLTVAVRESKVWTSAHSPAMTPCVHKGRPVDDFLCEDSCVCGHADGGTAEVRGHYSRGLPLLLLCSLSLVRSVVSSPLVLVISAYFLVALPPESIPSLPPSLPLSGLFILFTPQTGAVADLNSCPSLPLQRWATAPSLLGVRSCVVVWGKKKWGRMLMGFFFFFVLTGTGGCQTYHIGFSHSGGHLDHFTRLVLEK